MVNGNEESNYGCLYFNRKGGLSDPFPLSYGKTTLGSSSNCDIRIKGEDDLLCLLDSNKVGVTILVNEREDERVLLNKVLTKKYTILKDEDHLQVGTKVFKYSNPTLKEADLKIMQEIVNKRQTENSPIKRTARRSYTPLKRLQKVSPSIKKTFSVGPKTSNISVFPKVSERDTLLAESTSTPNSALKARFSQRISKAHNSSLGALKENEMIYFQNPNVILSPLGKNKTFTNISESKIMKDPTPKKNKTFSGNLKELDLNSPVNHLSPLTRGRMGSGRLSDASDITTPENNISAISITPLNVSKKMNRSLNKSRSLLYVSAPDESSTPKSTVKDTRNSAEIYRPMVEEITPVRYSVRISSLKKGSFSQRRSVNFNISISSGSTSSDKSLEEVSMKGLKRKRSLSDSSGLSERRKMMKNTSSVDSEIDIDDYSSSVPDDQTLSDTSLDANNSLESKRRDSYIVSKGNDQNVSVTSSRSWRAKHNLDTSNKKNASISTGKNSLNVPSAMDSFDSCDVQVSLTRLDISHLTEDGLEKAVSSPDMSETTFDQSVGKSDTTFNQTPTKSKRSLRLSSKILKSLNNSRNTSETPACHEKVTPHTPYDTIKVEELSNSVLNSSSRRSKKYLLIKTPKSQKTNSFSDPKDIYQDIDANNTTYTYSTKSSTPMKSNSSPTKVSVLNYSAQSPNLNGSKKSLKTPNKSKLSLRNIAALNSSAKSSKSNISFEPMKTTRKSEPYLKKILPNSSVKSPRLNVSTKSEDSPKKVVAVLNSSSMDNADVSNRTLNSSNRQSKELSLVKTPRSQSANSFSDSNYVSQDSDANYTLMAHSNSTNSTSNPLGSLNLSGMKKTPKQSKLSINKTASLNASSKSSKLSVSLKSMNTPKNSELSLNSSTKSRKLRVSTNSLETPGQSEYSVNRVTAVNSPSMDSEDSTSFTLNLRKKLSDKYLLVKSPGSVSVHKDRSRYSDANNSSMTHSTSIKFPIKTSINSKSPANKVSALNASRRSPNMTGLKEKSSNTPQNFEASSEKIASSTSVSRSSKLRESSKSLKTPRKSELYLKKSFTNSSANAASKLSVSTKSLLETSGKFQLSPNKVAVLDSSSRSGRKKNEEYLNSKNISSNSSSSFSLNLSKDVFSKRSMETEKNDSLAGTNEQLYSDESFDDSDIDMKFIQTASTPLIHRSGIKSQKRSPKYSSSINSAKFTRSASHYQHKLSRSVMFGKLSTRSQNHISRAKPKTRGSLPAVALKFSEADTDTLVMEKFKNQTIEDISVSRRLSKVSRNTSASNLPSISISTTSIVQLKTPESETLNRVGKTTNGDVSKQNRSKSLPEINTISENSSRISNSIDFSFLDSSVDDGDVSSNLTVSVRRSSRIPRPSIDERIYDMSTSTRISTPNVSNKSITEHSDHKSMLGAQRASNDLARRVALKKWMGTPNEQYAVEAKTFTATRKPHESPKNDYTNIDGLKELFKTPQAPKSPRSDLSKIVDLKKRIATPNPQNSPKNDLSNISGLKNLMKTPKEPKSPLNDLTEIVGLKKLMATPKPRKSPKNDLTNIAGLKKLMKTPKEPKSPLNDLSKIVGVKKLMATPKLQNPPKNDLSNIVGLKKLMRTPKEQKPPKNDLSNITGVKKLMSSPKLQKSPDLRGVRNLMRTPKNKTSNMLEKLEVSGIDLLFNESKNSSFDRLLENKPLRTYSRSPVKTQQHSATDIPDVQEHVLKWIEDQSNLTCDSTSENQMIRTRPKRNRREEALLESDTPVTKKSKTLELPTSKKQGARKGQNNKALDVTFGIGGKPASTPILTQTKEVSSASLDETDESNVGRSRRVKKITEKVQRKITTRGVKKTVETISDTEVKPGDVSEIREKKTRGRTAKKILKKDESDKEVTSDTNINSTTQTTSSPKKKARTRGAKKVEVLAEESIAKEVITRPTRNRKTKQEQSTSSLEKLEGVDTKPNKERQKGGRNLKKYENANNEKEPEVIAVNEQETRDFETDQEDETKKIHRPTRGRKRKQEGSTASEQIEEIETEVIKKRQKKGRNMKEDDTEVNIGRTKSADNDNSEDESKKISKSTRNKKTEQKGSTSSEKIEDIKSKQNVKQTRGRNLKKDENSNVKESSKTEVDKEKTHRLEIDSMGDESKEILKSTRRRNAKQEGSTNSKKTEEVKTKQNQKRGRNVMENDDLKDGKDQDEANHSDSDNTTEQLTNVNRKTRANRNKIEEVLEEKKSKPSKRGRNVIKQSTEEMTPVELSPLQKGRRNKVKQNNVVDEVETVIFERKNTRSNRGVNRKYNDDELAVTSPSKKVGAFQKHVTFEKASTKAVKNSVNEETKDDGIRRSNRTRK